MSTLVPASLRRWFVVHAIVDLVFALPILIDPEGTLQLFGCLLYTSPSPRD